MRLRVLMIGPAEGALGGIASLVETILPHLRAQVEVLYIPTAPAGRPSRDAGKVSWQNLSSAVSQIFRFVVGVVRFRPHIIHLHTSQGIAWLKDTLFVLIGKATGRQVVIHVHAATFEALYSERTSTERRYTRWVFGLATSVIAVSETWRQKLGEITSIRRIHTFINCIDSSMLRDGSVECGSDPIRAVFVGSLGERKGVLDLIVATSKIRDRGVPMMLDIAGYEDSAGYLDLMNETIAGAGLQQQVRFVGAVQGEAKRDLLARSDIFVLPSYSEGLPIALLEAMAAGCAIVSTPVGGIPEVIIDGYNGFLIDPGDSQCLADRLQSLAEEVSLRQEMGKRNRALAIQDYDVVPYVARLAAFYERQLEARRNL